MKVESTNISGRKGIVKVPVDKVIVTDRGIADDAHSGSWHRQISMLSASSVEKFSKQAGRRILPGEFAENLTISGFDLTEARLLDRFRIGEVLLELTQIGKKCHGDNCAIFREVGNCVMPKEGVFCRVLETGEIKPGDEIEYLPFTFSFKIITLSDRAFSGEQEDLSGPKIEETIKDTISAGKWRVSCGRIVIPNEAELLKKEIAASCEAGIAVIITTGGSGVGPRNITPETIGETQVYTLPGSVKAAGEYCSEILKTVEHSLFMLKSINFH